jgi:diphthine-ammonia ligase
MLPTLRSLALEASLSCQHVHRIMDALRSNSGGIWEGHAQLVIYWLTDPTSIKHVKTCDAHIDVTFLFRDCQVICCDP